MKKSVTQALETAGWVLFAIGDVVADGLNAIAQHLQPEDDGKRPLDGELE